MSHLQPPTIANPERVQELEDAMWRAEEQYWRDAFRAMLVVVLTCGYLSDN